MNKANKPQARNVARYVGEDGDTGSWVDGKKTYVGRVKEYWPGKGYGFIACQETQGIFQGDVFLHKKQVEEANLEKGNLVTFSVEINSKSRPQARNVERVKAPSYASESGRQAAPQSEADIQMEDA
ncbi:ODA2 [Symbiodinium natans]|uniref:ODA2 protein n=1 Tax=Symbiodinium natans TaxID=878477 RepID=A0A812K0T3_9DINO|nr:ODA2 [Symbiodinium natans]